MTDRQLVTIDRVEFEHFRLVGGDIVHAVTTVHATVFLRDGSTVDFAFPLSDSDMYSDLLRKAEAKWGEMKND